MLRAVVDLPQPLSPTRLTVSRSPISKLIPSTALIHPECLRKNPLRIGK